MNTQLRARRALAEIPSRMGNLRVSTPTNGTATNGQQLDNSLDNISDSFDTPTTSPDEMIIRQRGRRRVLFHWSPPNTSTTNTRSITSPQKTPTKNGNTTNTSSSSSTNLNHTFPIRSSPRKRLLDSFSYTTPEKLFSPKKNETPGKNQFYQNIHHSSAKKLKFEDSSIIQHSPNIPLGVALKGLNNIQLIGIIQSMVLEQPEIEDKIRRNFPVADIKQMEDQLVKIKKLMFKCLPSSRLLSKTDSSAYSRASIYLTEFEKTLAEHCKILRESKHWDALLDYTMTIWRHVRSTPVWDNFVHNSVRRHCFKILSFNSLEAIRNGDRKLGENRLYEFLSRLRVMSADCNDISLCKKHVDLILNL